MGLPVCVYIWGYSGSKHNCYSVCMEAMLATFVVKYSATAALVIKASSFEQVHRRVRTFRKECKKLRVDIVIRDGSSEYSLGLAVVCPTCGYEFFRAEREACIVKCFICDTPFTTRLPGDNCKQCRRKLDCLAMQDFKPNSRKEDVG